MIAIDPGKQGAIAYSSPSGAVSTANMPQTEGDILDLLGSYASKGQPVYLENVHAMPGQGVTSMFTFGRHFGFLLGVLMALRARVVLVQPREWQRALHIPPAVKGQPKTVHKAKLRAEAQRLFPGKVTAQNADALLILEYARRLERGSGNGSVEIDGRAGEVENVGRVW